MAVPLRPVAARPGPVPVISAYREHQAAPAVARAVVCTWQGLPGWHRRMRHLPEVADLADVWDSTAARQVAAALAAGNSAAARRAILTNAVASRLASSGGPDRESSPRSAS